MLSPVLGFRHKIGDGQWLAHSDTVEHADFARSPKDLRVKSAMFATTVISDGAVPPYGRADVKCKDPDTRRSK